MINIIYPVFKGDASDIKRQNDALNFKSLKIAGDFNGWRIEPMERKYIDRQPIWNYSIDDSVLENCKHLNDKGEILIHFKFIDDYNNWFTVSDYSTEPDEHNNINNVEVVKLAEREIEKEENDVTVEEPTQETNIQKVVTDSETEILDGGTDSPVPSLKEKVLQQQEYIIEESDVASLQRPESDIVTENDLTPVNNAEDTDQKKEGVDDVPDKVIVELEMNNKEGEEFQTDSILEKRPDNIPESISVQHTQEHKVLLNYYEEQSSNIQSTMEAQKLPVEINTQIALEREQTPQLSASSQETTIENTPDPQIPHEEEQFYSPKKDEELDSKPLLENPVAQDAPEDSVHFNNINSEKDVDIENHNLTVTDGATEEYQNILRRLLRGFSSWFSWFFNIFHSSG